MGRLHVRGRAVLVRAVERPLTLLAAEEPPFSFRP